jgi:hypothetical protein
MEVGATDAGERHLEDDVAVPLLRLGKLLEGEPVTAVPDECSHAAFW